MNSAILNAGVGVLLFLAARFLIIKAMDFYSYIKNPWPEPPLVIVSSDGLVFYHFIPHREQEIRDLAGKIYRIKNIFIKYQNLKQKQGRKIKKILYPSWFRVYLCFLSKQITMKDCVELEEYNGKLLRVVYED